MVYEGIEISAVQLIVNRMQATESQEGLSLYNRDGWALHLSHLEDPVNLVVYVVGPDVDENMIRHGLGWTIEPDSARRSSKQPRSRKS